MRGDLKGTLVPREALNGPIPGAVAQISGHQIVPGHMGTTGSTYRFEFNTDDTVLARVWDGTYTSFFIDSDGLVTMRNQLVMETASGSAGTQAGLDSQSLSFYLVETDAHPAARMSSTDLEFGAGGATAQDTNLYRSAANVLQTDDQFVASDGITSRVVSAAGRVNGSDADFTVTPGNGTVYVVRNSTDSKVYITARANGSWKAIEVV